MHPATAIAVLERLLEIVERQGGVTWAAINHLQSEPQFPQNVGVSIRDPNVTVWFNNKPDMSFPITANDFENAVQNTIDRLKA
jgi:hypothetical protein